MLKLLVFVYLFICSSNAFTEKKEISLYGFKELYSKSCKNPCQLKPEIGTPFRIEWKYKIREDEETSSRHFIELTLNGKKFELIEASPQKNMPLQFYQELIFNDHRFQIYSLPSSNGTRTAFSYYFRRINDVFYLLTTSPIPTLEYDYNTKEKKENEKFFSINGIGGYYFNKDGIEIGPQYRKTNYRLEDNRLIETSTEY